MGSSRAQWTCWHIISHSVGKAASWEPPAGGAMRSIIRLAELWCQHSIDRPPSTVSQRSTAAMGRYNSYYSSQAIVGGCLHCILGGKTGSSPPPPPHWLTLAATQMRASGVCCTIIAPSVPRGGMGRVVSRRAMGSRYERAYSC